MADLERQRALARALAIENPRKRGHELLRLRRQPDADQEVLAAHEHGAFTEALTSENPLWAAPLLAAIPGYQLAKLLRLHGSRSEPSLDQMAEAYRGMGRGLVSWVK